MFINNKITQISTLLRKNKKVQTQRFAFKLTEKKKERKKVLF